MRRWSECDTPEVSGCILHTSDTIEYRSCPGHPRPQADTGHAARRGHTTVLTAGDVAPIWHDLTSTGARASTQNGS